MKKILFMAVSLAAAFSLVSCEETPEIQGRTFTKNIQVDLGAETRAISESTINEATLFVYQKNNNTGETVLFDKKSGSETQFDFELIFSDAVQYTYDIKAYANMGNLQAEPEEILFSNENEEGLQFHGELGSINETSESSVTIDMIRYIGKITIKKIELSMPENITVSDFIINSIYLANVAEKVGGEAYYNTDGYHTVTPMDSFLYKELDMYLGTDGYFTGTETLYGYATENSYLMIDCSMGGKQMYYRVPFTSSANVNSVYNISICELGSETPFGEPMTDSIIATKVLYNVVDYATNKGTVTIGDKGSTDVEITLPEA